MLKPTFAQPLQHRPLGSLSFIQQSAIHEPTLLGFRLQVRGLAQVGLVGEHNEKFCLLSIGCVFRHPRRDLA